MRERGLTISGDCSMQSQGEEFLPIDHEITHLTKLRSEPREKTRQAIHSGAKMPIPTIKMLYARESNYSGRGRFSLADCSHVLGRYLPVNGPWRVDRMDTRAYVSQFSADGSLFVAGFQGSRIKMYDVEKGWALRKDIVARSLRWTITDTALSPDQRYLVYASITPILQIVDVRTAAKESYANITEIHEGLTLAEEADDDYSFGIFSVKFSTDGRELVAGGSDASIYVYDLEENKLSLRFLAHTADVNTVAFADETGHIIYSGSDDNLCKDASLTLKHVIDDVESSLDSIIEMEKHDTLINGEKIRNLLIQVWDRRCLISRGKPAGILEGHLEGITFIDSRRDDRYFISNGKDQTTKLWDIRMMVSAKEKCSRTKNFHWDYRWMEYPSEARNLKHPNDMSIATYRGHSVLQTLIRCYFSPAHSTGQKYIYTGSNNKCVYIYDLVTGAQVAKLACHSSTVRDCSWHPYYPMLVSSSWDCMLARWEFSDNDLDPTFVKQRGRRRQRRPHVE